MDTGSSNSLEISSLSRVPSAPQLTSIHETPYIPPQVSFAPQMPSAPPDEFDSPPNYEEAMSYIRKK